MPSLIFIYLSEINNFVWTFIQIAIFESFNYKCLTDNVKNLGRPKLENYFAIFYTINKPFNWIFNDLKIDN